MITQNTHEACIKLDMALHKLISAPPLTTAGAVNRFVQKALFGGFSTILGFISGLKMSSSVAQYYDMDGDYDKTLTLLAGMSLGGMVGKKAMSYLTKSVGRFFDTLSLRSIDRTMPHSRTSISRIPPKDLNALLRAYAGFKRVAQDFDPRDPNDCAEFLFYLRRTLNVAALKTIAGMGANPKDCHLDFFENIDARRKYGHLSPISLTWLAAKACVTQGVSLERATPETREVLEYAKRWTRRP